MTKIVESYDKEDFERQLRELNEKWIITDIRYSVTNIDSLANHGIPKILYSAIVLLEPRSL